MDEFRIQVFFDLFDFIFGLGISKHNHADPSATKVREVCIVMQEVEKGLSQKKLLQAGWQIDEQTFSA
eukprot:CAMPEP_0169269440 /NCGR_PEP_ID=MMETSP1016-20121227/48446_1 /TAXON_ID=342587 /ORGANISM="Karlodinium micrum, Strain CCMP2283" /LENGTH=67 /DNA_ID=CAMNT_0009354441 /DNA_START=92 /DNA_END=292 /DNA_ORIENTATION=+